MKNFAKFFMVIMMITTASICGAQTYRAVAGLNVSKMHLEDAEDIYSEGFKWKPGLRVGALVEFPISEVFSIETGLLVSSKGFKVKDEEKFQGETYEFESKLNLLYLESPINAKASFPVGKAKIYGTFGPYMGLGLSGKVKTKQTIAGETETEEENIEWGADDGLKRFDFGIIAGAGLEVNAIQIGVDFGLGLANIAQNTDAGAKITNQVLGISLAYKIAGE